jgi:hypothetical protein
MSPVALSAVPAPAPADELAAPSFNAPRPPRRYKAPALPPFSPHDHTPPLHTQEESRELAT